jgi:hypothetical protein
MSDLIFGDRRFADDRRRSRKKWWFWRRDRRSRPDRRRGASDRRVASYDRRQFFDGRYFVFKNRRRPDYDRRGQDGVWVGSPVEEKSGS